MASNINPNFTASGVIGSAVGTTANTSSSGSGTIGTTMQVILTAGVNGTYIDFVRVLAIATAPTTMGATVGRIFASSITAGATTVADTRLIQEVGLPAIAADNAANPVNPFDVPCNFRLPAGWTLLWSVHAAPVANTNWEATAYGGDY